MRFSPDPLIFTHMPKCGGTTLQSIVKRQYFGAKVRSFDGSSEDARDFRALPQHERHEFNLLIGHMYFGMHRWIRPGATYMTMLRDPIERIVSFYYFVRRQPTHYLWKYGFTEDTTLIDLLRQRTCIELDNFQTRNLCSEPDGFLPFGQVTTAMRDEALVNLALYAAVGITERFDDSLRILTHRFGWQDVSYTPLNVTSGRPGADAIDSETLALIRKFNEHDIRIYDCACSTFQKQLAEAHAALADAPGGAPAALPATEAAHTN